MRDIKADIFNCGRSLFMSKGFKNTNVRDITAMTGVGAGTFYKYYTSKDKLFLEIYIKENEELKKHLMESVNINDDPASLAVKIVTYNINAINSNLILKESYNRELFSKLEKNVYEQSGSESIDALIREWRADGKIRNDLDDAMIIAILNSIRYIDIHKNEIGIRHFPQVLYYITEFIMKSLVK